jgi:hypothetical protein
MLGIDTPAARTPLLRRAATACLSTRLASAWSA